jgi:hypothetical protein
VSADPRNNENCSFWKKERTELAEKMLLATAVQIVVICSDDHPPVLLQWQGLPPESRWPHRTEATFAIARVVMNTWVTIRWKNWRRMASVYSLMP